MTKNLTIKIKILFGKSVTYTIGGTEATVEDFLSVTSSSKGTELQGHKDIQNTKKQKLGLESTLVALDVPNAVYHKYIKADAPAETKVEPTIEIAPTETSDEVVDNG